MNAGLPHEARFITRLDALTFSPQDLDTTMRSLDAWLAQLTADLHARRIRSEAWQANSAFAQQAKTIEEAVDRCIARCSHQWAELEMAHTLSEHLNDRMVLLVFGKFNSGKTSFCNFLADRFEAHGKTAQRFFIDDGRIVETAGPFKEGATETTARLQGVRLGDTLVLLDTPGLHSVSTKNADLTRRFTESADGMLWLTSSTSPGQVQELDELSRELRRNKPLLPVLTRSDVFDEDEVNGVLKKCLRNKSAANRALQEADVRSRAETKLVSMHVDPLLLKAPVSLSTYMAREAGATLAALDEAGFDALFARLLDIAGPSVEYKARKLAETRLHHLEEHAMHALLRDVAPLVEAFYADAQTRLESLDTVERALVNTVWRRVAPAFPEWLDRYTQSRDWPAMQHAIKRALTQALANAVETEVADLTIHVDTLAIRIDFKAPHDASDYASLHQALTHAVLDALKRLSADAIDRVRAVLRDSCSQTQSFLDLLTRKQAALAELKRTLRAS